MGKNLNDGGPVNDISVLDYFFTAHALTRLIAGELEAGNYHERLNPTSLAERAVEIASAVIQARIDASQKADAAAIQRFDAQWAGCEGDLEKALQHGSLTIAEIRNIVADWFKP